MERNEIPFLCYSSTDYAKILWKKGEAIGFYSVKPIELGERQSWMDLDSRYMSYP